jgi:hypothetical protein
MGLSAYLTFGLVVGGALTRVQALTSCLVSGVLVAVVTLTGVSHLLMRITPHHVKVGGMTRPHFKCNFKLFMYRVHVVYEGCWWRW